MRNNKKRFLTSVIAVLCIVSMASFTAMAAYSNINATFTRIASIATNNGCDAAEGLTVTASGNNKRLFVAKVNDDDSLARLFMYEDYTNMENGNNTYGVFTLSGFAGHANGMAIDDNYIYITCWKNTNGTNGNKIVRISRSMLWNKYQSTTANNKGTLYSNSDGVTILNVYNNSNSASYSGTINSITYYKDNKFIVNYSPSESSSYYAYTTAYISNGKFYVNNNSTEIFKVTAINGTTGQDIGYDADCGFFVTRWHTNTTNNSIIWIKLNSLSGTNRIYTPDNSKYRIIKVNGGSNYSSFELESVSIGSDNCMYASVNTLIPSRGYDANYGMDAVIRIERTTAAGGSKNFLGNYFTQG